MSFEIEVQNDDEFQVDVERLVTSANIVLEQHKISSNSAMTIVLAMDDFVQQLNHQFRGIDTPTDVLSFPSGPLPAIGEEVGQYLGDIVIAYPYSLMQAKTLGHDLNDSLNLLVVHGTLHLLGYDHHDSSHRKKMWEAQAAALVVLGVPTDIVPSLEESAH